MGKAADESVYVAHLCYRLRMAVTSAAAIDRKCSYGRKTALASYFGRTWITGEFPASLWSQYVDYDHVGPRTTNHAEGFHSSLNSRFGLPRPCLRTFLNWLQKLQVDRAPKPRRQCYIDNDARLWSAKQQYGIRIASIFTYLFPHLRAWDEFRSATEGYLNHCGHMLGSE